MEGEKRNKAQYALSGKIVTGDQVIAGYLTVKNGKIKEIGHSKPTGGIIDVGDCLIVPGFIDMHIHGLLYSLIDNGPGDLIDICHNLPRYGVTGFLPTLTPRRAGEDAAFLHALATTRAEGAKILGFHLEGPFLKLAGALTKDATSDIDASRVLSLIEAAKPYKAIFSISPVVVGIETLIPLMAWNGTPVFMTHTAATVEQTQRAIRLGAKHATHFYNVFPCPGETDSGVRPCGAVEAILADERVSVDFIFDGVHVDPVAVQLALACKSKGPGRVCFITDSNIGTGLGAGQFTFADSGVIEFACKGAPARSVRDGGLAGSGLTMDQALRNAVKWLNLDVREAVKLVSTNPAKVLGVDDRKGLLLPGYDADLVILDKDLNVVQTWIGGECFFEL